MNQMNHQPKSKQTPLNTSIIDLHSIFYTIQGEGPYAGNPAIFVRLAGCNLRCPFCDTEYTSGAIQVKAAYIVKKAIELCRQSKDYSTMREAQLVVITGGEPLRQRLGELIDRLVDFGFRVQIETNGTLYDPGINYKQVTVVCSPKTGSINKELLPHIDALKYVVHRDCIDPRDGLPVEALGHPNNGFVAKPPADFDKPIYLQPIDVGNRTQNKLHLNAAINSCMKYGYILCIQIHKLIDME